MSPPDDEPVADVYAGDIAVQDGATDTGAAIFLFRIVADADPDVLARIAGVFLIANVAPLRVDFSRSAADEVDVAIAIALGRAAMADLIHRKLAQLTCVISVAVERSPAGVPVWQH